MHRRVARTDRSKMMDVYLQLELNSNVDLAHRRVDIRFKRFGGHYVVTGTGGSSRIFKKHLVLTAYPTPRPPALRTRRALIQFAFDELKSADRLEREIRLITKEGAQPSLPL